MTLRIHFSIRFNTKHVWGCVVAIVVVSLNGFGVFPEINVNIMARHWMICLVFC